MIGDGLAWNPDDAFGPVGMGRKRPRPRLALQDVKAGLPASVWQRFHQAWVSRALRVAKPGAFLLAFGGARTYHRLTCGLEDAGWIIRDCLTRLCGSGFPKSLNLGEAMSKSMRMKTKKTTPARDESKGGDAPRRRRVLDRPAPPVGSTAELWKGWGTNLKPAWEPIVVAMKLLDGGFARNAEKHGVAGLNIDAARIPGPVGDGVWGSNNTNRRRERKFNHSPRNHTFRSRLHPRGRWPANALLGHHPERGRIEEKIAEKSPNSKKRRSTKEAVETWGCRPDCPVRLLDEQTDSPRKGDKKHGEAMRESSAHDNDNHDEGVRQKQPRVVGASRFFIWRQGEPIGARLRASAGPGESPSDRQAAPSLRFPNSIVRLAFVPLFLTLRLLVKSTRPTLEIWARKA